MNSRTRYFNRILLQHWSNHLIITDLERQIVTQSGAIFSPCHKYRYLLWRRWDDMFSEPIRWFLFAGANPSFASAIRNDNTVSQMRGRAQRMGYGGLLVVNADAYVSTDPKGLIGLDDPCGPDNHSYVAAAAHLASFILTAWGNLAGEHGNDAERILRASGKPLNVLDLTGSGNPRHPRGVSLDVTPHEWSTTALE